MIHTYKILQLDNSKESLIYDKLFTSWNELGGLNRFDINDYETVYEGEIESSDYFNYFELLDELFSIFNREHPIGFKGHSLSVSDVVCIDGTFWYCDSFGWVEIPFAFA